MKPFYSPMLATLVDKPFDDPGWIFERKWDGYRAIASCHKNICKLYSRNHQSYLPAFDIIAKAVEKIPHNVVLDGELVVLDKNGHDDFQRMQQYKKSKEGKLVFEVFDLLYLDGYETTALTLLERKSLLKDLIADLDDPHVQYTDHSRAKGSEFFNKARKRGWEGMIAKEADSFYSEGLRSKQWLKVKHHKQQEAIIAGYTRPKGSRSKFGALLLGAYNGKKLVFLGHCGGGFDEALLKEIYGMMQAFKTQNNPFDTEFKPNGEPTWLKPKLVCEVKFAGMTEAGQLRQPIFLGLRTDKAAKDVTLEVPRKITPKNAAKKVIKNSRGQTEKEEIMSKNTLNKETINMGSKQVPVTHTEKLYWPKEGITKGDLLQYYESIAPYILPHLKLRPLSLHRFPEGIQKQGFYQKDVDTEHLPPFVKTVPIYADSAKRDIDYVVCNNGATLIYLTNLGCIDMNPWLSRTRNLDQPDFIVFDLDPGKIDFEAVVETAICIKEYLESLNITCYCKTSGSTGIHIFVPTGGKLDYDAGRLFAKYVATQVQAQLPKITSVTRAVSSRTKKVYIDYLQNSRGQTVASAYSVRPKPGATVSMPLDWTDINAQLSIRDFDIHNVPGLLESKGDIWEGVLTEKNNFKKAIQLIGELEAK
ncbi:DNA ligase D [Chitinophaga caeni]|uniref:DNA ligase (ATP) n=1 Tax=Chitinophaga caeni TaxID=2029983 RepID=A0A291QRF0_9BACT|nr:DNA ligase D [Chitinophaga caeni]ATL46462.1 DNA ligase D [Chitinophaga caeni]